MERKCDSCGENGMSNAQHKIVALPRVLTLHLKRIKLDLTTKSPIKLKTPIEINKTLELGRIKAKGGIFTCKGYFCDPEVTEPRDFDHGYLPATIKRDPFEFREDPKGYNEQEALEKV